MERIVVVDYGAGNMRSVETALEHVGANFAISSEPATVLDADRVIFPGVGEARAAMDRLVDDGLDRALIDFRSTGRPMLGICIGCQIVFERSEERATECLGLIPGSATLIPHGPGIKVPHIGWNTIHRVRDHRILSGIDDGASFYFVHSYVPAPQQESVVIATSDHGVIFPAIVALDNLVATQFHPEKSGRNGLRLLENFLQWQPTADEVQRARSRVTQLS